MINAWGFFLPFERREYLFDLHSYLSAANALDLVQSKTL